MTTPSPSVPAPDLRSALAEMDRLRLLPQATVAFEEARLNLESAVRAALAASPAAPIAWLRNSGTPHDKEAYAITTAVRDLLLKVDPNQVGRYTIPLYAHPVASRPLDDRHLQGLFGDAIDGALAFGYQGTNPPPEGHWLTRFWNLGRAAARPAEVSNEVTMTRAEFKEYTDRIAELEQAFERSPEFPSEPSSDQLAQALRDECEDAVQSGDGRLNTARILEIIDRTPGGCGACPRNPANYAAALAAQVEAPKGEREALLRDEAEALGCRLPDADDPDDYCVTLALATPQKDEAPEGWVLVPKVPTQHMLHEGTHAPISELVEPPMPQAASVTVARAVYAKMLAAAPSLAAPVAVPKE